jgi:hypothetical protein
MTALDADKVKLYNHTNEDHGIAITLDLFKGEGFVFSAVRGKLESVTKIMPIIDSQLDYMDGTYTAIGALKSRCEALIEATFNVTVDLPLFYPTIMDVMIKQIIADDGFLVANDRSDDDVQLYGSSQRGHDSTLEFNFYGMVSREDGFHLKVTSRAGGVDCNFPEMLESNHFNLKERCEDIISGVFSETIKLSDHFYHCIIYQSASKMFNEGYAKKRLG